MHTVGTQDCLGDAVYKAGPILAFGLCFGMNNMPSCVCRACTKEVEWLALKVVLWADAHVGRSLANDMGMDCLDASNKDNFQALAMRSLQRVLGKSIWPVCL